MFYYLVFPSLSKFFYYYHFVFHACILPIVFDIPHFSCISLINLCVENVGVSQLVSEHSRFECLRDLWLLYFRVVYSDN